ncbi:MAG: T9SS type A sorting domain-containing protein, partial [Bacteroidota bacterium]
ITINSVDEMIEIQILDITGKTIKKINQISNNQPIELKQLPTGIYNLLVVHNDGFTTYKQFIKQ